MKFLQTYVERVLAPEVGELTPDTPLFWSRWPGRKGVPGDADPRQEHLAALQDVRSAHWRAGAEAARPPARGRHGGARAAARLEQVRALLGHRRLDTTQIYASIRPAQFKRAVAFYEDKAARLLGG